MATMAVTDAVPTSFEADLAIFIQLREQEESALWAQADWAMNMAGRYGRHTARMIAAGVGLSEGYIRQLIATAKAFPEPDTRAEDLSFSHHRIAAMTEDPAQWLDTAVDHQLSVDELREAIRDAADPIAEADETERAEKRVARAVDRYNEQWSLITGRRAVLSFERVGA